ncbi:MAG: hypothetical protein U0586_08985 [Candidatus Brocadiaceae bacterium]
MKTIAVDKTDVLNFLKLNLVSEIQSIKKSLELFEIRYDKSFKEFEKEVLEDTEVFEKWDDYMEWKAYNEAYKNKSRDLRNLKSAKNIKIVCGGMQ